MSLDQLHRNCIALEDRTIKASACPLVYRFMSDTLPVLSLKCGALFTPCDRKQLPMLRHASFQTNAERKMAGAKSEIEAVQKPHRDVIGQCS